MAIDQESLIAQAVAGDRSALEDLLLAYTSRLTRHISAKLPATLQGITGVDDILQQTFVQAFRQIGDLKNPSPRSFAAWLRTTADRKLQDAVKAQQRHKRSGRHRRNAIGTDDSLLSLFATVSGAISTPSKSAARHEANRALRVGIASLPPDQRQAIELHVLQGKSLAVVAQAMNRTPGAVRALVHRGKQQLREYLGRSSRWFSDR